MQKLRDDARERGMKDLAMFYGWEAYRTASEGLKDAMGKIGKGCGSKP